MDLICPFKFKELCWPHITFYDKQRDIVRSVRDNDFTVVPAGHMLGKDFITAFIMLWFFVSRPPVDRYGQGGCRIVSTSVDGNQLSAVLWGEMNQFIDTSLINLPLEVNHLLIRKLVNGRRCPKSYILGRVTPKGSDAQGLAGHHIAETGDGIPKTLFVSDEASAVEAEAFRKANTWSHRTLIIGNTYECQNDFRHLVTEGDKERSVGPNLSSQEPKKGYRVKIIKITAKDSPNVRVGLAQVRRGEEPTNEILVPGVKSYARYLSECEDWDPIKICVGHNAEFYEGAENLLYPPECLNDAEDFAESLTFRRVARTIGVDPGEGVANTAFSAIDDYGLIEQYSIKTIDTSKVLPELIAFAKKHGIGEKELISESRVYMDAGGGGKQHADYARERGYRIVLVGFGESATMPIKSGQKSLISRRLEVEERYVYKNKRAEMYGMLSLLLETRYNERGEKEPSRFVLPRRFTELRKQLAPIPRLYDKEGRLYLPPKNKTSGNSNEITLVEMLGRSPDEADSLVLAVYGLHKRSSKLVLSPDGFNKGNGKSKFRRKKLTV